MTEHDVWDEGSELSELRELHRDDQMPGGMRERLLRRVRAPSLLSLADISEGVSPGGAARPSWVPAALIGGRRSAGGAGLRRAAYGLGASALVAAGLALWISGPSPSLGVVPQQEPADSANARQLGRDRVQPSGDPNQAEMRVVGWFIPESLAHLAVLPPDQQGGCRYVFGLRPLASNSNVVLRVESAQCLLPDPLISPGGACVKVTADGYLGDDGHLEASRLTAVPARCPP
jgi:hypothetical protein